VVVAPSPGGGGSNLPSSIYAEIKACVGQGRARPLEETSYDLDFDVEVTEGGQVSRVRRRGLSAGDGGMESCIAHALEGMEVPPSAVQALVLQAEAGAGSLSSRGLIGSPALLGVPLGAIMVFMVGATIVVTVTAYLAHEEAEAARRRRKSKIQCYALCDAKAEVCEEKCRITTKEGTVERRLCWIGCNEGNGKCKKEC
jgi:hypothetical protein